jgi:hypothetical protein
MTEKFIRFQMEDHFNTFSLGAAQNKSDKLRNMDLNDLNVDLYLCQFYNHFRVAGRTFYAYHHGTLCILCSDFM